jgi:putative MFS transporter
MNSVESIQRRNDAVASIAARIERLPITRYQILLLLIVGTAWFFDSIDLGSLTFVLGSIKSEFHLTSTQTGLLSSMSFVGMFFGASIAGVAADRFGRKSLFQISMLFWGFGSALCAVASDINMLTWARILIGFGMGMEFPIAQAIASEISPAKRRGFTIAILEGCWPLGFICAGVIAAVILTYANWRIVFLVEALPALFVFVVRRAIPESPRWLADNGLFNEAEIVMTKIEQRVVADLHGRPLPEPVPIANELPDERWYRTFGELWSKAYRKRTFMLWLVWFSAMLGYYGLTTWLATLLQLAGYSVTKSILYTVGISVAGLIGAGLAALAIEPLGRRWTCATLLIGGAVGCYLYGTAHDVIHLIVYGSIMQFCLFGMWSILYAYTPELYPTRARATGSGFASAVGRLGSLAGPVLVGAFVLPMFGQFGVFAFGAGAFGIAALAILIWGEETKGKTIEAIAN